MTCLQHRPIHSLDGACVGDDFFQYDACSGVNMVRNLGSWIRVKKFKANFGNIPISPKCPQKFDFFQAKNVDDLFSYLLKNCHLCTQNFHSATF